MGRTAIGVVVATITLFGSTGVATGTAGVKTKVFIGNALLVGDDKVELLGGLSARDDSCLERRKVVVFDAAGDDKLGATKAKDGSWEFTTGAIATGDSVYAKVKRKVIETDDGRVTCKGGKSKAFALG